MKEVVLAHLPIPFRRSLEEAYKLGIKEVQQDQDALLLKQAEISFKAGMKEVVDVAEEVFIHTLTVVRAADARKIQLTQWRQNKKEWGVE